MGVIVTPQAVRVNHLLVRLCYGPILRRVADGKKATEPPAPSAKLPASTLEMPL